MQNKKRLIIKSLRILTIIAVLVFMGYRKDSFFGHSFLQAQNERTPNRSEISLQQVQSIFENARSFVGDGKGNVAVYDINNGLLGIIIPSKPYSDSLYGFAGPVHFLIGLNNEDKVAGLLLTEHNESPGYINFIENEGFFESIKNKTINDIISRKPDAISGATLTCDAISIALQKRLAAHLEIILKTKSDNSKKKIGYSLSILVIIFALLHFFIPKVRKYRVALLILSIGILGFYQGSFISLFLLQSWAYIGVPIFTQWLLAGIVIISILLPLIFNKSFYCNYLCPYGAAQELAGRLNKRRRTVPFRKSFIMRFLRESIFYILIILVLSGINIDLTNVEPFTAFIFKSASMAAIILAVVFLILSVFFNKPWCYYFCPTGQFLAFFRVRKSL